MSKARDPRPGADEDEALDLFPAEALLPASVRKRGKGVSPGIEHLQKLWRKSTAPRTPVPEASITTDTGWLSPEGDFYPCGYAQHKYLADDILAAEKRAALSQLGGYASWAWAGGGEAVLEQRGWMRTQPDGGKQHFWGFQRSGNTSRPTEAQCVAVSVYCRKKSIKLPKP